MEQILQLDLSNYMDGGVALKSPSNLNKPDKQHIWNVGKERCGLYEFQPIGSRTREQLYSTFITLYRSKLHVLHTKLADMHPYRNFIKNMYETTLSISMYIIKYEFGDELYCEIRRSLCILFEAIDYLVTHDGVERVIDVITVQEFHQCIHYLKLINFMKHIKQQKKLVESYPIKIVQQIKNSYVYQVLILGTFKNLKSRLEQVCHDVRQYDVKFDVPVQDKIITKSKALWLTWETLYNLVLPVSVKDSIYQDIKKSLM